MSFNLESIQSLSIPININAFLTPLPKRNTLHYLQLLDKPNSILTPSSNSKSIFLYNYTVTINLVLTLHKILSTTTKTKDINIAYHYTRSYLINNIFQLAYIFTKDNAADIMTKGLTNDLYSRFTQLLECFV